LYVTTGYPVDVTIDDLGANASIGQLIIPASSSWNDAGRILSYNSVSGQWKSGPVNYNTTVLNTGKGFKVRRTAGAGSQYFKIPKPY
jgi:hypothetical protein